MRWTLLSLWLLGGILYAVGAFTPSKDDPAPTPNAATVRPDATEQVLKSAPESGAAMSLGTYAPVTAEPEPGATSPTPEAQTFTAAPETQTGTATPEAPTSAATPETETVTATPETQTVTANDAAPSDAAVPPDDAGQFSSGRLLRGAPVHSGPSVSSDIVGYAAAGSDLELVERKDGWAKVVDPATSRQGWIYEEHITMTEGLASPASVEEAAAQDDAEAGEPSFKPNKSRKKHAKKRWRKQLRFVLRFRR